MSYFEAGGQQFAPLPEGVTPTALVQGMYHDTGYFGPAPCAGAKIMKWVDVDFTDVDGVAQVEHGFRGRPIMAVLVFAGSLAWVDSNSKTTLDALKTNTRYTITMPGGTSYDGCKLIRPEPGKYFNLSGGVVQVVPCLFMQLSETN